MCAVKTYGHRNTYSYSYRYIETGSNVLDVIGEQSCMVASNLSAN